MASNLLDSEAEALVNTVNTVGVMGKGIAVQFRRRFPEMFRAYERAAQRREVRLGRMHVWDSGAVSGPRWVINFPTKGHWRARSRVADIEAGLADLVRVVREKSIGSIAVPPLGWPGSNGSADSARALSPPTVWNCSPVSTGWPLTRTAGTRQAADQSG